MTATVAKSAKPAPPAANSKGAAAQKVQKAATGGAVAGTDSASAELSKLRKKVQGLQAANATLQGQAEERADELQVPSLTLPVSVFCDNLSRRTHRTWCCARVIICQTHAGCEEEASAPPKSWNAWRTDPACWPRAEWSKRTIASWRRNAA